MLCFSSWKFLSLLCVALYTPKVLLAEPVFLHSPSATIYFVTDINTTCTTKDAANISWVNVVNNTPLDSSTYGIRQENDTVSRMTLSGMALTTVRGTLVFDKFICRATALSGTKNSSQFGFTHGSVPSFGQRPRNAMLFEGNETNFECSFSLGTPNPLISWTFTSRLTGKQTSVGMVSRNPGGNPLKLKIDRYDAGVYTCQLSNQFRTVKASATLSVNYANQAEIAFIPTSTVALGSKVGAICTIEAVPLAQSADLYRDNKKLQLSPSARLQDSFNTTVFNFSITVDSNSDGNYSCQPGGYSRSEPITLTVIEATLVDKSLPRLCWKLSSNGISVIHNSTLSCSTEGRDGCTNASFPKTSYVAVNNGSETYCVIPLTLIPGKTYKCEAFASNDVFERVFTGVFDDIQTPLGDPSTISVFVTERTRESFSVEWCVEFSGGYNQISSSTIHKMGNKISITFKLSERSDSELKGEKTLVGNLLPDTSYSVTVTLTYPGGNVTSKTQIIRTRPTNSGSEQPTSTAETPREKSAANNIGAIAGGASAAAVVVIVLVIVLVCCCYHSSAKENTDGIKKELELEKYATHEEKAKELESRPSKKNNASPNYADLAFSSDRPRPRRYEGTQYDTVKPFSNPTAGSN